MSIKIKNKRRYTNAGKQENHLLLEYLLGIYKIKMGEEQLNKLLDESHLLKIEKYKNDKDNYLEFFRWFKLLDRNKQNQILAQIIKGISLSELTIEEIIAIENNEGLLDSLRRAAAIAIEFHNKQIKEGDEELEELKKQIFRDHIISLQQTLENQIMQLNDLLLALQAAIDQNTALMQTIRQNAPQQMADALSGIQSLPSLNPQQQAKIHSISRELNAKAQDFADHPETLYADVHEFVEDKTNDIARILRENRGKFSEEEVALVNESLKKMDKQAKRFVRGYVAEVSVAKFENMKDMVQQEISHKKETKIQLGDELNSKTCDIQKIQNLSSLEEQGMNHCVNTVLSLVKELHVSHEKLDKEVVKDSPELVKHIDAVNSGEAKVVDELERTKAEKQSQKEEEQSQKAEEQSQKVEEQNQKAELDNKKSTLDKSSKLESRKRNALDEKPEDPLLTRRGPHTRRLGL